MSPKYLLFLSIRIPWDFYQNHSVQKWLGNSPDFIGGADEEDFGQVNGKVQKIVHEIPILFRIENLQ